ncbi:hypothetical protein [Actinomadura keratinilytica]
MLTISNVSVAAARRGEHIEAFADAPVRNIRSGANARDVFAERQRPVV